MTDTTNGKHKHCDLIVAWANGAKIEYSNDGVYWSSMERPGWFTDVLYRIKPEPKQDIVLYGCIVCELTELFAKEATNKSLSSKFNNFRASYDNVKLTYSGETLLLKSIEMIEQTTACK